MIGTSDSGAVFGRPPFARANSIAHVSDGRWCVSRPPHTEIAEDRITAVFLGKDVLWLEVAVRVAGGVNGRKCVGNLRHEVQRPDDVATIYVALLVQGVLVTCHDKPGSTAIGGLQV